MNKFLLMSTSALAIMALPAFAADVVAPEPVANWTAFHIGVGGGAGYNEYDAQSAFEISNPWETFIPDFIGIESDEGKFYGFGTIELGFDYQFDNSPFVVGILGNYDFNGKSDANANSFATSEDGFITADINSELEDTWFVGGRAGFVIHDTTLVYGLGGYTWAKGKVNSLLGFDFDGAGDDFGFIDKDESVDGFTAGAGIETMLTESLSLKLEYRHDFLDSIKWNEAAFDPEWGGVDEDNTSSGEVKFSRDTLRAVISWRFGMGL